MTSQYGGRVPLPPVSTLSIFKMPFWRQILNLCLKVPELDRSDHERESMSPQPQPKQLPSPLTTPIRAEQQQLPIPRARRHTPMAAPPGSQHYQVCILYRTLRKFMFEIRSRTWVESS